MVPHMFSLQAKKEFGGTYVFLSHSIDVIGADYWRFGAIANIDSCKEYDVSNCSMMLFEEF